MEALFNLYSNLARKSLLPPCWMRKCVFREITQLRKGRAELYLTEICFKSRALFTILYWFPTRKQTLGVASVRAENSQYISQLSSLVSASLPQTLLPGTLLHPLCHGFRNNVLSLNLDCGLLAHVSLLLLLLFSSLYVLFSKNFPSFYFFKLFYYRCPNFPLLLSASLFFFPPP